MAPPYEYMYSTYSPLYTQERLRQHGGDRFSSFKVGRVWQLMLVVLTPIVLVVILATGAFDYIVNGYGSFPWWYVAIAGWGTLALLLVASFSMSYRAYGRIDADTAAPADTGALAREVEADLRRIRAERAEAERNKK